jgi:serine/threonine protein kinase
MNVPGEPQWARVEELGLELSKLPSERIASRISELKAGGESTVVLSLLGTWLALPPPPSPVDSGSIIGGRYTIREKLGEGGMGSVWRAKQELVGRDVALKIIHPSMVTPTLQTSFISEIELLGQLNHPGIVRIYDAGMSERPQGPPLPYFVMELVDGQPLDRWAGARRGERAALLRTASAICVAVQSAHERRIIHRDLKPSNILVRPDGLPVVVDFGIARLTSIALGEDCGGFSGTPQYAAPEQHLGRDLDFRSGESVDVYAMGAILFEILSGRRLFQFARGASLAEMRSTVLEGSVPRLADILPDCPRFLDELVARAVRRDPADRFYSIASLGRAISRSAELLGPAPPSAPWKPAANAVVPGTQWRLITKMGEGGVGEVWSGTHDQLGERRVFKFCDTEEKARTLKRELTLFRLLKDRIGRNPHFISLHEVSLDEPPWYLMMDYVDAQDLESWCGARAGGLATLPERQRLEIVIQAAEALQAAHEVGILHRDIKPANLLVRDDVSKGVHVFIADFGLGQIVTSQLLDGRIHNFV